MMATNNEAQVQDIEIRLSEKVILVILEEVLAGIHGPPDLAIFSVLVRSQVLKFSWPCSGPRFLNSAGTNGSVRH